MNYKVGDKVRVKSLEWYNKNKNEYGDIKYQDCQETQDAIYFIPLMTEYCGQIVTIDKIWEDYSYSIIEDNHKFYWTDDMFEGLVESNELNLNKVQNNEQTFKAVDDVDYVKPVVFENIVFPNENYADKVELCLGDDYEIVVEDGRTFVQKKKPKYPKTYEECCGVLGMTFDYLDIRRVSSKEHYLYSSFFELIRCRDAYWKVADNWKPDWKDDSDKYFICYLKDEVWMSNIRECNRLLVFPTKEMRDAFFENFKDLIEKCKELL